jgi:uncharacterized protein with HEPN domain
MRLKDILEAIERVRRYTEGMTFDDFCNDTKTVDAVVRNVTVIGEAARHVAEDVVTSHPDLPWREMRDIRNVVVHEYFGISLPILWETIRSDLPPLTDRLRAILEEEFE